ncbi:MAG: hypothetical protein AAF138_02365 [Planctomycetota bacterium]
MNAPKTADRRLASLLELTSIPTAAGREQRVVAWIKRWVSEREGVTLERDRHGNLTLSLEGARDQTDQPPVYFTAHLDHPAFVVERVISPTLIELVFRGGVMEDYFIGARVIVHDSAGARHTATLTERDGPQEPYKRFVAELDQSDDDDVPDGIRPGDIATWDLPASEIAEVDGVERLLAPVCDDLAAAASALASFDELRAIRADGGDTLDARLLFTRAEEVGFIGAIAACRDKTIPADARVIALENSRASAEAPIGGGPIVRVGDRLSVFDPKLTNAVGKRMEAVAGGPAHISAQQKKSDAPARPWQRKLMPGGACEASVFCAFGYSSTCVCLPLGNYHNMGDLDAVQAGGYEGRPPIAREEIAIGDFHGMTDLLVACGTELTQQATMHELVEKLWRERSDVLAQA